MATPVPWALLVKHAAAERRMRDVLDQRQLPHVAIRDRNAASGDVALWTREHLAAWQAEARRLVAELSAWVDADALDAHEEFRADRDRLLAHLGLEVDG